MTVARFANAFFRCSRSRYFSGMIAMARTSLRWIARRGRKRTPQTWQLLPPRYGVATSLGLAARGRPNEEGLPLRAALPLSSRDPADAVERRSGDASNRVDPHRGKDPAHGCRRSRR